MKTSGKGTDVKGHARGSTFAANHISPRRIWKLALLLGILIALSSALERVSFAQRTTSVSTQRGFLLFGDVKVDESQVEGQKPMIMDVILYTKGMQVFARQRVSPNG